jgi:hypothetical protein
MGNAQATDAASIDCAVQDAHKIQIAAPTPIASQSHRADQVEAHDGSR